jgi:hypothetical protein
MTYKAISNPLWKLKDEFNHLSLPKHVSFHGAMPSPKEAYEVIHKPSMEINDRGRITYSNYFYGKILQTMEEAQAIAEKLNNKN